MKTTTLAVLAALILSPSPSPAAGDDFAATVHDPPYALEVAAGGEARVGVPIRLTPPDLKPEEISIDRMSASFGSADPAVVTRAFAVDVEVGADADPHRLLVTFDPSKVPGPTRFGTYGLALDLSAPGADDRAARRRQTLELDVVYPQTQLFTLQPLVVEHTRFFWQPRGSRIRSAPLYLEAKEGPAPGDLTIHQFGPARVGDLPVPGQLKAGAVKREGKVARVPVEVAEGFPLGDATGTLHVTAPEMELASVGFTVKTREHWVVILAVVVLGLVAGFFLRTYFDAYLERRRNRLKVQQLLRRVVRSRTLGRDDAFDKALKGLETDLTTALDQLDGVPDKDFATKLQAWQKRLDDALVAFETRRTALAVRAGEVRDLLRYDWRLPAPFGPAMTAAGTALAAVDQTLELDDLTAAEDALDGLVDTLRQDLSRALEAWSKALLDGLQGLPSRIDPPLPDTAPKKLTDALGSLRTKLQGPAPDTAPLAAVKALLTAAYEGTQLALGLLDQLAGEVATVAHGVATVLADVLGDGPRLEELETARRTLRETARRPLLDAPAQGIGQFESEIGAATEALQRAIHDAVGSGQVLQDVKALLSTAFRKFGDVFPVVVQASRLHPEQAGRLHHKRTSRHRTCGMVYLGTASTWKPHGRRFPPACWEVRISGERSRRCSEEGSGVGAPSPPAR